MWVHVPRDLSQDEIQRAAVLCGGHEEGGSMALAFTSDISWWPSLGPLVPLEWIFVVLPHPTLHPPSSPSNPSVVVSYHVSLNASACIEQPLTCLPSHTLSMASEQLHRPACHSSPCARILPCVPADVGHPCAHLSPNAAQPLTDSRPCTPFRLWLTQLSPRQHDHQHEQ